jgi:hypothetical protein
LLVGHTPSKSGFGQDFKKSLAFAFTLVMFMFCSKIVLEKENAIHRYYAWLNFGCTAGDDARPRPSGALKQTGVIGAKRGRS